MTLGQEISATEIRSFEFFLLLSNGLRKQSTVEFVSCRGYGIHTRGTEPGPVIGRLLYGAKFKSHLLANVLLLITLATDVLESCGAAIVEYATARWRRATWSHRHV